MSSGLKSKQFTFKEYSQKAIISKMPLQYIGAAKQLSTIKKQRMMSQQIFESISHDASTFQKINDSLSKSLNKKKKQLKYMQGVRDRYISEVMQKEKTREKN